jgi:metal-sulfur cluster biosynthetic enzyme
MTTSFGNKIIGALYEKQDDMFCHLPKNADVYFRFDNPMEILMKDCANLNNEEAFMLFIDVLNKISEHDMQEFSTVIEEIRPIINHLIPRMLVKLKLVKLNKIMQEQKMTSKVWKIPTYSSQSNPIDDIVDEAFTSVEKLGEVKKVESKIDATPNQKLVKKWASVVKHSDKKDMENLDVKKDVAVQSTMEKTPETSNVEIKKGDTKQREVKQQPSNISGSIINVDGKWVHEKSISYINIKGKEKFIKNPSNPNLKHKSTSLCWKLGIRCLSQDDDWYYHGLNGYGEPIGWYYVDENTWKINASSSFLHVKNEDNTWSHYEEILNKKGEIVVKPISVQWLSWFMTPGPFKIGTEPVKYII